MLVLIVELIAVVLLYESQFLVDEYNTSYILIRYAQPNIKNLYPNSGVRDNMDNFQARGLLPVN